MSLLVTHAARGMAGSTSRSNRPATASRSGGVETRADLMKMSTLTFWRSGCNRVQKVWSIIQRLLTYIVTQCRSRISLKVVTASTFVES